MELDKDATIFKNDVVTSYPNISEITFTPIDKKYLIVLFINYFLLSLFLFLSVFGLMQVYFEDTSIKNYSSHIYISLIFLLIVNFIFMYLGFKKRKYAVREKDITYKKGVLISKLTTVPYNRIQHLNVTESFFGRVFKLSSLHIFTAGDDSSDLVIKGLTKEKAYKIREYILQKIKNR